MTDLNLGPEAEFVSVDGNRTLKWRQIAYGAWKEGIDVEPTEDGYIVGGEEYERK